MSLFALSFAAFSAGFGLGYLKFYLLGFISSHQLPAEKVWIIQIVGALLTLGPFLIYWLAAPLATAFPKRAVMFFSAAVTAFALFVGDAADWYGTPWLYIFLAGLLMGVFNPAKNAAVPLAAVHGGHSTEVVNAILNITYIFGLMAGIPAGAALYESGLPAAPLVLWLSFAIAGLAGTACVFPQEKAHLRPVRSAAGDLARNTRLLFRRHTLFLLTSPLLWGIGSAASLAVTAYAEEQRLGGPAACSLMSVYAVVGVMAGNLIARLFSDIRKTAVTCSCLSMTVVTAAIPLLVSARHPGPSPDLNVGIYTMTAFLVGVIGLLFGLATNLIEGEYFRRIYAEHREGTGGALLSAATALFPFLLGGFTGLALIFEWFASATQFIWLAAAGLAVTVLSLFLPLPGFSLKAAAAMLLRAALRLRYRIVIHGWEKLSERHSLLILPNHPAETDPMILGAYFWRHAPLRPVMLERYYYMPVVHFFMRVIRAIPVPDLSASSGLYTRRRVQTALNQAAAALNRGENILMYPSGRIMLTGREKLGGNSGLAQILQNARDTNIILVRTTGLYGSIFSAAAAGKSPDFGKALLDGLKALVENLLFFAPKRTVTIEIEPAPSDFPAKGSIQEMNQWLERWYNLPGEEQPTPVSLSRWRLKVPVSTRQERREEELSDIPEETQRSVRRQLASQSNLPDESITPEKELGSELGLDSLQMAEVLEWLREEHHAADVSMSELTTVGSVMRAAHGAPSAVIEPAGSTPSQWLADTGRPAPSLPTASLIEAAFLDSARRMRGFPAMADDRSGVLSWRKLEIAVHAMASELKNMPGDHVGVMLPASAGAAITILAVMLAGKVPVMLNWTVGSRNLEHAAKLAGLKTVLTSGLFLDQIEADIGPIEGLFVFLEEVRKKIGLRKRIRALLKTVLPLALLRSHYRLQNKNPEDTAVILFTSGSEAAPKGVPLTHRNILCNIQSAVQVLHFSASDVIYGFLPPFHSFGLTATTLLPLLIGVRAAYYPNPNESRRLALGCGKWLATVTAGTPTFLRGLLKAATNSNLATLRLLIAGAEKAPEALFELAARLRIDLIEGYGVTECSPFVCVNRLEEPRCGVGAPMPGVELLIIDVDTHAALNEGLRGLVLIRGKNVFSGYLGQAPSPFLHVLGKHWYNSGDLGLLDNGRLILAGRLKRFVKIGGEMVSLPAVEETLLGQVSCEGDLPCIAVTATEGEDGGRPELYLFTTLTLNREQANNILRKAGLPNLVRIKDVVKLEELPLLGTGKVNYRALKTTA